MSCKERRFDLKKNTLFVITWLYGILLVITFAIYAYNVADANWTINTEEQRPNLITFAVAIFFGTILFSVNGAAQREKGDTVKKSTVYVGLSIAAFFIVWRLLVTIF